MPTLGRFPIIYPTVKLVQDPVKRSAGAFVGLRPMGVTVHATADRNRERAIKSDDARNVGYHLLIDRDGMVYQTAYLDRRVNHAGPSNWEGQSCNQLFAAVALVSWGKLEADGRAWNGDLVPPADIVTRPGNIDKTPCKWDACTPVQEQRLLEVLRWFVILGVNPRNICGHDEAAIPPGRKSDPGGALKYTMEGLRQWGLAGAEITR